MGRRMRKRAERLQSSFYLSELLTLHGLLISEVFLLNRKRYMNRTAVYLCLFSLSFLQQPNSEQHLSPEEYPPKFPLE
jgi:hypothetical protein